MPFKSLKYLMKDETFTKTTFYCLSEIGIDDLENYKKFLKYT